GLLVLGMYVGHGAIWVTLPIVVLCSGTAAVSVSGRPVVAWAPVTFRWLWRGLKGQRVFRARVQRPRPAGTLALPGDAAALRQWVDPDTGAVMVHDPHASTLTAVVGVVHPAFVLLDPADQERRVQGWSRVLATACRSGRLAGVQVMERTLPDAGSGLAQWWARNTQTGSPWASEVYEELIERAGPAGERHASTISISLDIRACGRAIRAAGGGIRGAAVVLRQEMDTLTTAARSADLSPS